MTKPNNGKSTLVLTLEEMLTSEDDYGPKKLKVQKKVLINEIKTIKYHCFLDKDYPNTICYYDNIRQLNANSVSLSDKALHRLLQYYPDLRTKLDNIGEDVKAIKGVPSKSPEANTGEKYTRGTMAYYQITGYLTRTPVSKLLKRMLSYADQYKDSLGSAVLLENKHGQQDKSTYTAVTTYNITSINYHTYHDSSGCNNEIVYEADDIGFTDTECITDAQLSTLLSYYSGLTSKLDSTGERALKDKLDEELDTQLERHIVERDLNVNDADNNIKIYTILAYGKDKSIFKFIPYEYIDKIDYAKTEDTTIQGNWYNFISYTYSVLNDANSIVSLINDIDLGNLLTAHPELMDKLNDEGKKFYKTRL